MHPLRQHTGICNSCGGGAGRGGGHPFALPLFSLFSFPFGGFLFVFSASSNQRQRGGRRQGPPGPEPPRTLGGDPVSGRGKTDRHVVGCVRGGAGMETRRADPYGGVTGSHPPLRGPPLFHWFSMGRRARRAEPSCSRDRNGTV